MPHKKSDDIFAKEPEKNTHVHRFFNKIKLSSEAMFAAASPKKDSPGTPSNISAYPNWFWSTSEGKHKMNESIPDFTKFSEPSSDLVGRLLRARI